MMDPAKLKVVELRAELQTRGLDTKGNKPVLVKRLKEAFEAELQTDLPDTSIADTSTEDISSQDEDAPLAQEIAKRRVSQPLVPKPEPVSQPQPSKVETLTGPLAPEPLTPVVVEVKTAITEPEPALESVPSEPCVEPTAAVSCEPVKKDEEAMETQKIESEVDKVQEEHEEPEAQSKEEPDVNAKQEEKDEIQMDEVKSKKVEQNGENANGDAEEESVEPKAKKSRWGNETDVTVAKPESVIEETRMDAETLVPESIKPKEPEHRGDKRKHSSTSPERNQPIREDEPAVDSSKVQLSWYDSDLHLQIDKTNFLSAKPLNDGLFGYIWSGARLTHGVKADKACFEVKITEELKFEDILSGRERDYRDRRDRRDNRRDDRDRERSNRAKSVNDSEKSSSQDKNATKVDKEEADKPEQSEQAVVTNKESKLEEPMETDQDQNQSKPIDNVEELATTEIKPEETAEVPKVAETDKTASADDKEEEKCEDKSEESEKIEKSNQEESKPEEKPKESEMITKPEDKPKEAEIIKVSSHLIRVGWSVAKASLQLGEDKLSFGLESSGKFYTNKTATDGEATFKVGDVVRAYVDMDKRELAFAVNDVIAFTHQIVLDEDDNVDDFVLFPHVLTRNFAFEVNAGDLNEPLSTNAENYEDYKFVSQLDEKLEGVRSPEKREECEVIMMCGLPGAGKTHWVKEYVQTVPEKHYNLIGTSFLMDRMTVDSVSIRPRISPDRLNFFWDKLGKSINRLCEIAALRRRDFILDQTNVFPTAIRRKMRSFLGFKRHAVIVVNEDEEQEKRMKQQDPETGKDIPVSALLEMKANMDLPVVGEYLDKITYISLPEDKAQEQVQKYIKQGRDAGFGNIGHHRRDHRDDRSYNNRWHQRGGSGGGGGGPRREYQHRNSYRDRPYPNNRYDRNYRQGSGGGGGSWRPGGGSGSGGGGGGRQPRNNDRRQDNRGPRDWRNNNRSGGMSDRPQHRGGGNRDHRPHNNSSSSSYNRNRSQGGSGGSSGGRNWGGSQGGWSNPGGGWNSGGQGGQDAYSGWNQTQGSWNQNHWKYGGGYNQGGYSQYPQNWNYYGGGNYSQDWSSSNPGQGQSSSQTTSSTTNATDSNSSQYAQLTSQQQQAAWAQYAQQYAQNTSSSNSSSQK